MSFVDWYEECRRIMGIVAGDAFRKHRDNLLVAVTDVHILANSLYSRGLVSREQLEHAQLLALTPSERKVHLFDAIEARLRSKLGDFCTLLSVLNGDPLLEMFVEKINSTYAQNVWSHISVRPTPTVDNIVKVLHDVEKWCPFPDRVDQTTGNEGSAKPDESVKKESLLSGVRRGIRKLFGAARDMTASLSRAP